LIENIVNSIINQTVFPFLSFKSTDGVCPRFHATFWIPVLTIEKLDHGVLTNIKKEAVCANNSSFCLFFVEKRRTFALEFTRIPSEGCQKG
jgi:hypothetical protein